MQAVATPKAFGVRGPGQNPECFAGHPGPAAAGSACRAHFSRGREKCGLESETHLFLGGYLLTACRANTDPGAGARRRTRRACYAAFFFDLFAGLIAGAGAVSATGRTIRPSSSTAA